MKLFTMIALCLPLLAMRCKDNSVTPVDNTPPGRRDYVWTVDTISIPEVRLRSIDGISPSDVWAVSDPGDFRYTIFHFDGSRWSSDGLNRSVAPRAVRAFAANNAWIVGARDVWHYDGLAWKSQARLTVDSATYWSLEDIDGTSSTNLYSVGLRSYLGTDLHPLAYHYSNGNWSRLNINEISNLTLYKVASCGVGRVLVLGSTHIPDGSAPDSSKIFALDGERLSEIYSGRETLDGKADFARISNGAVLLEGRQLVFFDGVRQRKFLTIESSSWGGVMAARSTNDVFLGMSDGIAHFNGSDLQYIYRFEKNPKGWMIIKSFDFSLFVVVFDYDTNLNLVYRGYLQ